MRYSIICLVLLFLTSAVPASAQEGAVFVELNYMKSLNFDYPQIETELWKPIHQERIRRGTMLDWAVYSVRFGDVDEYDYVTVNVYGSMEDVEGLDAFDELVSSVHPDADPEELFTRTGESRRLVRSELWQLVDQVDEQDEPSPAQYVQVDYMDVPSDGVEAYLSVEQDLWKPMHEATLGTGGKVGWALYSLVWPHGTDYPHNYATTNAFSSLDVGMPFAEAAEAAHPDVPVEEISERTLESRDLVKGQLWSLVDATD